MASIYPELVTALSYYAVVFLNTISDKVQTTKESQIVSDAE